MVGIEKMTPIKQYKSIMIVYYNLSMKSLILSLFRAISGAIKGRMMIEIGKKVIVIPP